MVSDQKQGNGAIQNGSEHMNGRDHVDAKTAQGPSLRQEWSSVLVLVVLYALQGVPLGLSMGSMPFLMQARMSYTAIGLFSLAGYPYSFKLFWSPVVDATALPWLGRRKSWIVPLQLASAALMILGGPYVQGRLDARDAAGVTVAFFFLVLLAATQDIAVDGWALELLSPKNVGYASTCQTVGMNLGYFLSFTVFLALSDPGFCNVRLRPEGQASDEGIVTLAGYLRFWGWVYLAVTLAIAVLKREEAPATRARPSGQAVDQGAEVSATRLAPPKSSGRGCVDGQGRVEGGAPEGSAPQAPAATVSSIREAYMQLLRVMALPAVRQLALVLTVCRLGMLPAESAAALKLLEKGVSKEALAALVLLEFPMETISAVLAGRWAASGRPFRPWLLGYKIRLVMAALSTVAVHAFPAGAQDLSDAPWSFAAIACLGIATSFCSTLMFTAIGSFFNKISDTDMGGAYLTLLNTISNIGVTVPKFFVFVAMDAMTRRTCVSTDTGAIITGLPRDCCPASAAAHSHSAPAHAACVAAGGVCAVLRDGFYPVSAISIALGLVLLLWLRRVLPILDSNPMSCWRAPSAGPAKKML